ncbi:MAG: hypothetical protein ACFFAO_03275 [Candidatus Hermodarchaeota archaeon]
MITEISVFLPNNPGVLAKFINLLNKNNIQIKSITAAETPDYGLLLLLVDNPDNCIVLLQENNYEVLATAVLAIKLSDDPNALFDIADVLGKNEVNIEYLYNCVVNNTTLMIVRVSDNSKAQEVLKKKKFILVEPEEL